MLCIDDRVSGAQQRARGLQGRSLRSRRWALGVDGLYQKPRLPRSPLIPLSLNCGETFATRALPPLPKAGSMPATGDGKAPGSGKLGSREQGATRAHPAPRQRLQDASGGRAGGARAPEPAAARGRSAGRAGRGRERARAPHTPAPGDAQSRVGAVGRPAPSTPVPQSLAGVCSTGVGLLLFALSGPRRQGLRTGPQPRTAWTRRLSRTRRRQSKPLRATGGGAEEARTAARGRRGRRRSRPLPARGAAAPARPGPPPPQRRARNEQAPVPGSPTEGPRLVFSPRCGAAGARSPRPGAAGSPAASSGQQAPGLTATAAASGRRSRAGVAAAPPLPPAHAGASQWPPEEEVPLPARPVR